MKALLAFSVTLATTWEPSDVSSLCTKASQVAMVWSLLSYSGLSAASLPSTLSSCTQTMCSPPTASTRKHLQWRDAEVLG